MKKFFILFAALVLLSFSSGIAKSSTMIGGGLAYGTEIKELAIQVGAIIDIDAPVDIAPDLKYYLTDEFITFWELNANVHYALTQNKGTNFYLLGGLNYATQSVDVPFLGSVSSSEIGLNLGAGAKIELGGFILMPEIKYVLSEFDQLVLGASAMFAI